MYSHYVTQNSDLSLLDRHVHGAISFLVKTFSSNSHHTNKQNGTNDSIIS